MNASNELREKMWELCYDLLPDGERSALIAQIKSDPQAARLYAEVRLQADLVGFAAKVEDPSLILSAAGENLKATLPVPAERAGSSRPAPASGGARAAWATWIPATAALVLIGLIVGGVYAPVGPQHQLAQAVLEVDAPLQMPAGVSSKIVLRSRQPGFGGQPSPLPVNVKVLASDGRLRFQTMVETNADGVASVELPGQAVVPGARLEVESSPESLASDDFATAPAPSRTNANFLAAALPVTSAPPVIYYMFDTPVAQAGEEVSFAAIAVEPFTLEATTPPVEKLVVKDAAGTPIVEPMHRTLNDVVEGTFQLPPSVTDRSRLAGGGEAVDRVRGVRSEERKFSAPLAETDLAKTDLAQDAKDASAKIEAAAALPLRQKAQENADKLESLAATPERYLFLQNESRGDRESLRENLERVEQEGVTQLDRSQAEKNAPAQLGQGRGELAGTLSDLAADKQVVEAGQPVEVEIPAELADKRIVADVTSRGVSVVRQVIDASGPASGVASGKELAQQAALQKVKVYVPPEVDGELRLSLADASQSPAKVVSEQYFFRQPVRELKLEPQNLAARYDPGQVVSLKFKVVDENGSPAAASLGARVWREDFVPAREDLVMLADTIRQSQISEIAQVDGRFGITAQQSLAMGYGRPAAPPAASEPADSPLAAGAAAPLAAAAPAPTATPAPAPAPAAGDSVEAGVAQETESIVGSTVSTFGGGVPAGQGGELAASDPLATDAYFTDIGEVSLLVSNRAAVEGQLQARELENQRSRQVWQATLGRVLVIGGLIVLAGVGLLFLVRVPVRVGGGTLAIVAAAASLMVGLFWTGGQRQEHSIAMATGEAPQASPTAPAALPPRSNAYYDDRGAALDADPAALSETAVAESTSAPSEAPPALQAPLGRLDAPAAPPPAGPDSTELKVDLAETVKKPAGKAGEDRETDESGLKSVTAAATADKEKAEKEKADGLSAADGAKMQPSTGRAGGLGGGAGGFGGPAPTGGKSARFAQSKQVEDATAVAPDAPGPPAPAPAGKPSDAAADSPAAATTPTRPAPAQQPSADDADRGLARGGAAQWRDRLATAPAAIYFNPRLATDEQGFVTLEFQLPEVESEYRLLIDAFGNGRVGSSADLKIVCQKAEAK